MRESCACNRVLTAGPCPIRGSTSLLPTARNRRRPKSCASSAVACAYCFPYQTRRMLWLGRAHIPIRRPAGMLRRLFLLRLLRPHQVHRFEFNPRSRSHSAGHRGVCNRVSTIECLGLEGYELSRECGPGYRSNRNMAFSKTSSR